MPQSFNHELMIPIQEVMSSKERSADGRSAQVSSPSPTHDAPKPSHINNAVDHTHASMSPIDALSVNDTHQQKQATNALQDLSSTTPLSGCEMRKIDKLLSLAPTPAAISIDSLKVIQESRGWVSDESLLLLSQYTGIPISTLDSVATFYNLIFRQAVGEIVLHPCDGISCDLMGGKQVRDTIIEQLNIQPGETTLDNKFTLIPLPCLGACDKAPVMIATKQVYKRLDTSSTIELIKKLAGDKE